MRNRVVPHATLLAIGLLSACAGSNEPAPRVPVSVPPPVVTAEADAALKRMSRYMQAAESLAFEAEVTYDVLGGDGQKIQYGSHVKAAWQPRKRLQVDVDGDEFDNRLYVDGGRLVWVDDQAGIYARDAVPGGLDDAIDDLLTRLGLNVPLTDLFYSDPYAVLSETAHWGRLVGVHEVQGVKCLHLAYVADGLDWQIWIEEGERPLPRKLVIDYRDREGSPMYAAVLTSWEVDPELADDFAVFTPTPSEHEVEFLIDPAGPAEEQ